MTDRELLEKLSDGDRKKLLNRWWDRVFLVLGILGTVFAIFVIMAMTPEDRSSGEVIFAVILFFILPPVILLLIGLRKKIFWKKEKQDAYILKRLSKDAVKTQPSVAVEPITETEIETDTEMEFIPTPEPAAEKPAVIEEIKQTEPEEKPAAEAPAEPEPEIEEEEEDPVIILFPEA